MATSFPRKALGLPLFLALVFVLLVAGWWVVRPAEEAPAVIEGTIVGFYGRLAITRDSDQVLARVRLPGGAERQISWPKGRGLHCQAGDKVRLISHRHRLTVAGGDCERPTTPA